MTNTLTIARKGLVQGISTLFFIAMITSNSFSQDFGLIEGYYITPDMDTITGYFDYDKVVKNILKFKKYPKQNKWKRLSPEDIIKAEGEQGFLILADTVSFRGQSERIFIQRVASGGINLYRGFSELRGRLFFLNTIQNTGISTINGLVPDKYIRAYFKDCSNGVTNKITYKYHALKRALENIHECAYPNEDYKEFSPGKSFQFGIGASAFYYTLDPAIEVPGHPWFRTNYSTVNRLSIGVIADIRFTKRFSFRTGLSYINKRMVSDSVLRSVHYNTAIPNNNPYFPIKYVSTYFYFKTPFDLNFKYLEIPLEIQYNILPHSKICPVLSFGLLTDISQVSRIEQGPSYPDYLITELEEAPPLSDGELEGGKITMVSKVNAFPFVGIGIRREVSVRSVVELKIKYTSQKERFTTSYGGTFATRFNTTVTSNRIDISLNYIFYSKSK